MNLWESKARIETIQWGKFSCPHCEKRRSYRHIRVVTYFSVLGFPLFEDGILADYIECQKCERQFAPNGVMIDDLAYPPRPSKNAAPPQPHKTLA